MPDPIQLIIVGSAAAGAAFIVLVVFRVLGSKRSGLAWTLGIGAGFYVGWGLLGVWPTWPPINDRDRFLILVMPAALLVESLAACAALPRLLIWILRTVLAASIMPLLLYGKSYYEDSANPGTQEWPLPTALKVGIILAELLLIVWFLLERLQARTSERTIGAALCLSSATAGAAIMYSGYLSGGQFGIPLAGALAGATIGSLFFASATSPPRFSGVGLIGLFSVLILGKFLGELPTLTALSLLLAPLAAWIPESQALRHLGSRSRAMLGFALVAVPILPSLAEALVAAWLAGE